MMALNTYKPNKIAPTSKVTQKKTGLWRACSPNVRFGVTDINSADSLLERSWTGLRRGDCGRSCRHDFYSGGHEADSVLRARLLEARHFAPFRNDKRSEMLQGPLHSRRIRSRLICAHSQLAAVTGRVVAIFHELSCRVATQRRTKICGSAYAVTRLGGQRLVSLHGAVSPPMSLARDADLAQRTVALSRGAREGETFLSVS